MARHRFTVRLSENCLRELILAAIEAYDVPEPTKGRKSRNERKKLETWGLLWGYSIPGDSITYCVEAASVDIHAYRSEGYVEPNEDSLNVKTKVVAALFNNVGFLGNFHSHPYDDIAGVKNVEDGGAGYDFSDGDIATFQDERWGQRWWRLGYRVSLVVTICELKKLRGSVPSQPHWNVIRFDVGEFRMWINALVVESEERADGKLSMKTTGNRHSATVLEIPYIMGGLYAPERLKAGSSTSKL